MLSIEFEVEALYVKLKKVIITGFKSFRDRTQISFDGPILCVVGPNGCGKSNLVDAFRWVLGEQSSQLRGALADDVLFHGGEGSPPANKAEVSLHFVGCKKSLGFEQDEIEITRKLTREKDSEYLINRQSCRLKEIHQLLSQTGLGKSSAIIEQGKLDQLIYLSPLERGKIFIQASGVDHVLQRKKETDAKVQEIQMNYDRVFDALELKKKELQHLQRQAKIATHFQMVKQEIEEIEKALCYLEFQTSQKKKAELEISLLELEVLLKKNSDVCTEQRSFREKKGAIAQELQSRQESLQELLWKRVSHTKILEERKHRLDQDQKSFLAMNEKKKEQKKQLEKRLVAEEKERNSLQEKLIFLVQEKKDSTALLHERQKRLSLLEEEHQILEKEREQMHQLLLSLLEQERVISLRLSEGKLRLDAESKMLIKVTESLEGEQKELVTKERFQEEKMHICQQLAEEDRSLQRQIELCQEQKEAKQVELLPLQKAHLAMQEEIQQLTIQKATLLRFLESQEGFSRGAKFFLQEAKKKDSPLYQKVLRLFDLLSLEEGREQLSITALYRYLDTVVVETKKDTELLITLAKQQKIDSFSFVCVENLSNNVGELSKLYPEKNIGQQLVGQLSLEEEFLPSFFQKGGSFVSKDGFFVDDSRVVFFVANSCIQSTSPIRKKEFAKVEATLEKLQPKESNAVLLIGQLEREIKELQKEIEQVQAKRHKVQMSHVGENMHLQNAKKVIQECLSKIEQQQLQTNGLTSSILAKKREIERVSEEEKELAKKICEQKDQQFLKNLDEKKKELRLLQNDFFEKQKQDHILLQQEKESKLLLARIEEKHSELAGHLEKIDSELRVFTPKNEEMLHERKEIEKEISLLKDEISQHEEKKEMLLLEKKQCMQDMQSFSEQLEKHTILLAQLEQKKKDQKMQIALLDEQTKEAVDAVPTQRIEEGPKALKERMSQLKMQVKDENKINFASIDEVKERQKEFEEIDLQLEDIQAAKKDLENAVALLDQESQERFHEYFALVKKEFKKNFACLFSGGKADLRIRTTSDLFSSGIEILAEPPGKKMQRLSLFSGGEKSLTALALLFSFFAVRPGPFCLLDEVDAPLDETNVQRLTALLKEYGNNTQFVVITHNRKTMESANVLLGVSMVQKGVSRLLSVSFENDPILAELGGEK